MGGVLTAAGGVLFAMGMFAFASLSWYATDPAALAPAEGAALLEHVVANPAHGTIVQIAGFLILTLGILTVCVALLRAGTVGRALPVTVLVLTLVAFVAPTPVLNYLQAAQMVGLVAVAVAAVRAERR